jgi:hypothetical protein
VGSIGSVYGLVVASCEHDDERSGSIKGEDFFLVSGENISPYYGLINK